MKRILSLLLVACMLASAMSGCRKKGGGNEGGTVNMANKTSLGICVCDYSDEFSLRLRETAEAYADQIGCKYDISDGGNEQSTQNSQISSYVLSDVDALCVNLVDKYSGVTAADDARAAGIPIVFFSRKPVDDAMSLYDKAYYVGVNDEETGTMLGELMADCWNAKRDVIDKNGDGVLQCAVFTCDSDGTGMKARTDAAVKALENAGITVQKVREDASALSRVEAQDIVNVWYSDGEAAIEGIISAKDEVALGAIETLTAKGFFAGDNYMPIVSAGGIPGAVHAIAEGSLYGTVSLQAEEQTKTAIQLAIDAANGTLGETVSGYDVTERCIWIPCEKIDVNNYMDNI